MFVLFNVTTITVCLTLMVLTILSIISDSFLRRIRKTDDVNEDKLKPVSVVIISDNNANEIQRNLPSFLMQNYPAGYEIIVVLCKDEDGTKDILKSFRNHENLHITFVPDSSRYMSIHKLAITLGVKAAKNELVLLTDANCKPETSNWISSMASHCGETDGLVAGCCIYDEEATKYQLFDRLHRIHTLMYEASVGHAYAAPGKNLMFRKGLFMNERGFLGNLKYLRGEYDFLINKYSHVTNVSINTSADATMTECAPSKKEWYNTNMFYAETRKHLAGRLRHRFLFNSDMFFLHASFLLSVLSAVFAVMMSLWIILPFCAIALLCPFISRILTAKRSAREFNTKIHLWNVIPFELGMIFHNATYLLRYKFTDKLEFICHKS